MVGTSRSAELVGRVDAVERLWGAFDASRAGTPRHVVIGGESGVGKTRLLTHGGQQARDAGARVLVGNCVSVGETGLPFAPYTEIVLSLITEDGLPRTKALAGQAADDLARLVPALGTRDASAESPVYAETRLYQALFQLLRGLAAQVPLVVHLEDLHWADAGTLAATSFVMRSLRSTPVSIVATYRDDEGRGTHPLRKWLAEVLRNEAVERIELEPLDRPETAALIHGITDLAFTVDEIDDIHRRSDGNPFFVEQLLAARADIGARLPSDLRDVLLARVDALSEPARSLIEVASVGGRDVGHETLLQVVGPAARPVEQVLRDLVEAALLVPGMAADGTDEYSFRHALVREAVYGSLLPTERQRLHRAWAEALSHQGTLSGGAASRHVELAHHWREAHDVRALPASITAGDRAMASYSFMVAAREFEAALSLWPPAPGTALELDHVDLLVRFARAAYYSKQDRKAISAYREALDEITDDARRSLILWRLARSLWAMGEWGSATEAYEEALRVAPSEPPETRIRALAGLAQTYMANGQFSRSRPLGEEALERARATGDRQLEGHVLNTLGMDLAWLGQPDSGKRALDAALEISLELEDPDDVGRTFVCRVETLPLCGLTGEALKSATEGLEVAKRMGTMLSYGPYLHVAATYAAFQAGRWTLAMEHLEQADLLVPPSEMGPYRACQVLHLLAARGDPRARQTWEDAKRRMGELPPSNYLVQLHTGAVGLAAYEERFDDAAAIAADGIALSRQVDAWIRSSELARVAAFPVAELGLRARQEGHTGALRRAHESMDELRDLAASSLSFLHEPTGPLGTRLRLDRAQVDAERDRLEGRSLTQTWSEIAHGWVDAERPHRALYPRWRAAEAAETAGDRASAVAHLHECYSGAVEIGAAPLVWRLERMARRMRVQLGGSDPHGSAPGRPSAYGLTPREREVLVLLIAGRTNQQIADELFITRSTAGVHVSNILSKLGVATRGEAASLAVREELV